MEKPEPKSYAKRLVKGSTIIFTAMVLSAIVAILLRAFLARSLSVAEYGLFFAIFALISSLTLFYDLGLCKALVRHVPEFSAKKEFGAVKSSVAFVTLFESILVLSIITVIFVFSNQIALAVFGTGAAVLPLRILCVWFFIEVFNRVLGATFQGFQDMIVLALMRFFLDMSILIIAVLFVGVIGWGVGGAAFAYLVATLAVVVFGLGYFRWRYPQVFRSKISVTKPLVKKLFAFALPVFIGSLGFLVLHYMDTLMITVFRTLPEVGLYQVALPTAQLLWYFAGALTMVFFPMVSEMWAKREKKLLGSMLHFLIKFSFIFIIPSVLILTAFPDIIIRLIFGEGYLGGVTALQILSCGVVVYTLFTILSSTISGIGRPIIGTKVIGAAACLNLVGNLLLIPPYGIEGASIVTLGSYIFGLSLLFYYTKKYVRFTVPVMSLFKTVIGGVLTLLLILGLKSLLVLPPWPEAFAVMIPGLLFYGAWILATKAITKDDLRLIARIVPVPRWLVRLASRLVRE